MVSATDQMCAGLYELSQYAFLADRNGGSGLTWAMLHDPGCGMITVWGIFAAEWVLFLTNAWYLDQVNHLPSHLLPSACNRLAGSTQPK